jgi:hypothetical protein
MSAQIAVQVMEALGKKDIPLALSYATPDATASGGVLPGDIPLGAALQVMGALYGGISDFRFEIQEMQETGDTVSVHFRWGGTHDSMLWLNVAGLPDIPPTGKPIWVNDVFVFTFTNEKVRAVRVDSPAEGGIPGALAQVGAVPV